MSDAKVQQELERTERLAKLAIEELHLVPADEVLADLKQNSDLFDPVLIDCSFDILPSDKKLKEMILDVLNKRNE